MLFFSILLAASAAGTDAVPSCLHHVAELRPVAITAYDVAHDKQGSNSISCNFNLTASEAEHDLKMILTAATKKDCQSLVSVSNIPLSVQFVRGGTRKFSRAGICQRKDSIRRFLKNNSASFALNQLQLLGWRGAFLGSDKILINTIRDGAGRPHLKLVAIGPV
jgi:hypothetical protein